LYVRYYERYVVVYTVLCSVHNGSYGIMNGA